MIDIGINYITPSNARKNKYDDIYRFLVEKGYINTLKFPGKHCDYETLKQLISLANKIGAKIDVHGLPQMVPSLHSKNCLEKVQWEELEEIIANDEKITRFSTHMGLENKEKIENYSSQELEENINSNIIKLKSKMKEILNNSIELGVENIPGGFEFDKQTITPQFISDSWKKVDFGVFDISHAKIAANDLEMSYENYLEKIENKEKVKILHISGNIDKMGKYSHKPDKHLLISISEINDIIKTLKVFPNVDLVASEYAFNAKYSYEKELLIEAITLNTLVKTMDEEKTKSVLEYLEKEVKEEGLNQ